MNNSEDLDDCIIDKTPQKIKPFKKRKSKIKRTVSEDRETNQSFKHEMCINRIVNKCDPSIDMKNFVYKSPYVFYEIHEIIKFTETVRPANLNIRTLGIYKQQTKHYLTEHFKPSLNVTPLKVFLDFKSIQSYPENNKVLEIFGCLTFGSEFNNRPVLDVQIWNRLNDNFHKYVKSFRTLRHHFPELYIVKNDDESDVLDLSCLNINYTFGEFDESSLNRNVDYLN